MKKKYLTTLRPKFVYGNTSNLYPDKTMETLWKQVIAKDGPRGHWYGKSKDGLAKFDTGTVAGVRLIPWIMWTAAYGPLQDGHVIDVTCKDEACINPNHFKLFFDEEVLEMCRDFPELSDKPLLKKIQNPA